MRQKLLATWPKEDSLQLRSFAIGVLLAMSTFYAIVIFHADVALAWVKSAAGTKTEAFTYNVLLFAAMLILGMTGKFGALWVLGPKADRWKVVKQSLIAVSLYLSFAISSVLTLVFVATHARGLLGSSYWSRSQWFWQTLLVGLLLAFIALLLHSRRLFTHDVLRDLRALPVVCPLFCFAGPKFLLENFEKFGISQSKLRVHSALLIVSGILFLASLAMQAIIRPESSGARGSAGLLAADGSPLAIEKQGISKLIYASFALLGVAFLVFCVAMINVTMLLLA